VRFVVDTNVLVYAVNRDCPEHPVARSVLEGWLAGTVPWGVTWGIVYEFLRIVTHPKVFRHPLDATQALAFLDPVLGSELVTVLSPSERHQAVLHESVGAFGTPAGNIFHDLHTAVLMREHGVSEIMTADVDFRKFSFLTVTDPVHAAG
jgi:toxin-antitoxin system PIN domain toxin